MSIDPGKVTICLVMTILLVLMPHSGYLSNIDNQQSDLINENINEVSVGQIVLAPLGQRKVVGIIVGEGSKTFSKDKLKILAYVYEIDPIPLPSIELISFLFK